MKRISPSVASHPGRRLGYGPLIRRRHSLARLARILSTVHHRLHAFFKMPPPREAASRRVALLREASRPDIPPADTTFDPYAEILRSKPSVQPETLLQIQG